MGATKNGNALEMNLDVASSRLRNEGMKNRPAMFIVDPAERQNPYLAAAIRARRAFLFAALFL